MHEPLLAWYAANAPRPALAADPRPLRDPRQRGDAAADAGRPRRAALPGVARALADRRGAGRGDAGRRDPGVERPRVQPPGGQPAPVRAGRGGARRLPARAGRASEAPGIGPYTAAAVACFAFGAQIAAPDTNALRVLERAFPGEDVPSRPAAPTSGTRRSSTSAARYASPARRAAAPARSRPGARPGAARTPRSGASRASRARSGSGGLGCCARSRPPGGCPRARPMPRRSSRWCATGWPRCRTARRASPVRRAWRRAPRAPRARAAPRRANSRPAARDRPG